MTEAQSPISLQQKCRMDFTMETEAVDGERGVFKVRLKPDERRYSKFTDEAGTHYIDRFLKVLIPADVMRDAMAKEMAGLPIYSLDPSIDSSRGYAAERHSAIASELTTGEHVPPNQRALSHQSFLDDPRTRDAAFVSIDLVGGSSLRRKDPISFEKTYRIVFQEFASLIGQFQGSILKPTGDGCIAFIDHPAYTSTCDAIADLGLSLLIMLDQAVNPALEQAGLSRVSVRIGADYGAAEIRQIAVPATGFAEREVASDALNRAVKIEQSCQPNEFRVGFDLYSLMHVKWLERAEEVAFDPSAVGIDGYRVFRLR